MYNSVEDTDEFVVDPVKQHAYKHDLSDLIGIFWEFHKVRLNLGNVDFAYSYDSENGVWLKYDPNITRNMVENGGRRRPMNVVQDYSDAVDRSLRSSWHEFMNALGYSPLSATELVQREIPAECSVFINDYTKDLAYKVTQAAPDSSKVWEDEKSSVTNIVDSGIISGTKVTTRVNAIYGVIDKSLITLILSKVDIDFVSDVIMDLGALGLYPEYNLLKNPGSRGVNNEALEGFNFPSDMTCPAGIPVSAETKRFLKEDCGVNPPANVIVDFTKVARNGFNNDVRSWYDTLTEDNKRFIDRDSHRVMKGEIAAMVSEKEVGVCPFPHNSPEA